MRTHQPAESMNGRTAASPAAGGALPPPADNIIHPFVQPGQESALPHASQKATSGDSANMRYAPQQDQHCHHQHQRHLYHHRNQCNQLPDVVPVPQQEAQARSVAQEQKAADTPQVPQSAREQQQCPHHPQERRVRFDPTGQAWCNRLECWDCYRLMHIGKALGYPCLIDRGGARLIAPGQEAWSDFARTQRAFPVMDATEEAILACRHLGIPVPDLTAEVARLHTVHPSFPVPGTV